MKRCSKCHTDKNREDFYKDRRALDGLTSACKACRRAATDKWHEANPEKRKAIFRRCQLKRQYGITPEEYEILMNEQEGACAMCRLPCTTGKRLAVDHCHETDKVRGLLCTKCNTALGLLNDDPKLCQIAASYLVDRR